MRVKIVKPIKISEVGKTVLPLDFECEISDSAGKIFVEKGFVEEIKDSNKKPKPNEVIDLVNEVKTLEDLRQYESDKRATVVKAVAEKKLELETI